MPKLPSEKLRSLASSNKAKEFKQILETDLYPFLDGLPAAQRKSLLDVLNNAGNKNGAVVLVGYDTRSESISGGLRALVKSVKSDWKNGWEEQGELMNEVLGEILEWLPILWKVGFEMGAEPIKASRAEFTDLDSDSPERKIKDAKGRVVYVGSGSTKNTILWVWSELLISSVVNSPNDTLAKKIVADLKKLKLTKEILQRLDDGTLLPPKPKYGTDKYTDTDWEFEEKRDILQNAHWTTEMRAAALKVKALFA